MTATRENDITEAILAGARAGLIAGIVLAIFMALLNVASGMDPWVGAKTAGAPFLGERSMQPGFDGPALLVGIVSQLGVSIAWGAAFGLIFMGLPTGKKVAAGLAWGAVAWIVMYYIVLPLAGLAALARGAPVPVAVLSYLAFGLALAFGFVPLDRGFAPGVIAPWIDARRRRRNVA